MFYFQKKGGPMCLARQSLMIESLLSPFQTPILRSSVLIYSVTEHVNMFDTILKKFQILSQVGRVSSSKQQKINDLLA